MKRDQITDSTKSISASPSLPGNGRHHVLDLDDFTPNEIGLVLQDASAMSDVLKQDIRKVPVLRGKSIITLFAESSTRTRVSFEQAGKILGADVINVSGSGSSSDKGESLYNTALTLQAMNADIIIIRHPHAGSPYFLAQHLSASVINAGDGAHAHPSQALLDLYTIQRHLGNIAGLKIVIVGDILYSRVARSNLWGMAKLGAHVVLCGPPTLLHPGFIEGQHLTPGHPFSSVQVETTLEKALIDADVVMALRLQQERHHDGHIPGLREYSRRYGITLKGLSVAKPNVLVMHPGPMNEGVEIAPEVAHGVLSVVEEQVTNGVAVRMAILHSLATGREFNPDHHGESS